MRAEDLPEITLCADTAEQLGALRETLRIDETASGREAADGFRASEAEGVVSMLPATGAGGPLEITSPPAAHGENAPIARPHPGVAWGQGPEMRLRLLGGADRPPQSAAPKPDFLAVNHRLRELESYFNSGSRPESAADLQLVIVRVSHRVTGQLVRLGGSTEELLKRPPGTTPAEHAYRILQETARQADNDGSRRRAGAIRRTLDELDDYAVKELQAVITRNGITAPPPTRTIQLPLVTAGPTVTVAAIPPPVHTPTRLDWIATFRQVRDVIHHLANIDWGAATMDFRSASLRITRIVVRKFKRLGGNPERLLPPSSGATKPEQAYRAIEAMFRRARESGDTARANEICHALEAIKQSATSVLGELTTRYGALDTIQAMRRPPAGVGRTSSAALSVTAASTPVPPTVQLHVPVRAHPIAPAVNPAFPEPAGGLVHATVVPGPTPASSLPGPSRSEAGDLGRWRLDPLATAPGTTAAEPAAIETIVTPSLGGTSSFWLQPANPGPAPVTVPFDPGLHHAGETAQPPPVTTAPSSIAPALSPGAAFLTPSWLDVDFTVERALLADMLPPGFDASRLIDQARSFAEFGLADELAARRLPIQTIDVLMDGYRANDEGSRNAQRIESLRSLKESIERALHAAYPGQVEPEWLDLVRALEPPRRRGEPASPSAASATALPELGLTDIARLVGTGEGALHPAPLPPPSAPGRTGAGAGAPPPTADRWGIRPQGMSGGPHPVAFDPWFAPPGPSSRVVYTRAIRTPVMSTGAPPRWLGAETPGFARAASGAVELPFWRREEIALRFGTEDAVHDAELTVQLGGADALGWSVGRWLAALADLGRINAIVQSDSAAAAAMVDVDWSAIEALVRILDDPSPSP